MSASSASAPAAPPTSARLSSSFAITNKQLLRRRGGSAVQRLVRRAPVRRTGRSAVAVSVQANLFTRLFRIVTSFFNGLVESFEDPEVGHKLTVQAYCACLPYRAAEPRC